MPPEKCFWVWNGPILKDLPELARALDVVSDEQFYYHVNAHKNDFAKWVEEVLGQKTLAKKLRAAKTRAAVRKALASYA